MEKDACEVDNTGGTGAYSAHMIEDTTLPDHTIYVPKNATGTLPVVLFGNMLCLSQGAFFKTMLTEIASHGFMVVASGSLKGKSELTRASMLTKAVDWANGPAAQKYGKVDASSLAVVGHGCGGLEALSASYQESRVTYTVLLNSGVYEKAKLPLLQGLKAPLAYFVGGQPDIGFPLAERDYPLLNIPVLKASIKVGHLGTFYQKRGGAQGQALVKYLSWKQKGDSSAKALFCSPADGTQLVKTGWSIESKNGMC
ncbi:hypothetical protein EJ08DRAFT_589693 [Tothia fuscella]|uniref:Chlorophyllase n=1 Tax=Tothia fuscella TaxID=1048955 RepID=A0A9P4NR48_9PEZI|nr:hypothetical protein EJ08DRAFT_589693 [Tothia fuscella]